MNVYWLKPQSLLSALASAGALFVAVRTPDAHCDATGVVMCGADALQATFGLSCNPEVFLFLSFFVLNGRKLQVHTAAPATSLLTSNQQLVGPGTDDQLPLV